MASRFSSVPKKGKYKVWALDEVVTTREVSGIKVSPCTSFVGLVFQKKVEVFHFDYQKQSRASVFEYISDFQIEGIEWSSNSDSFLIFSLKCHQFVAIQNFMHFHDGSIFRVQGPESINLISVFWAPDNQHILSVSDCNIFTIVHSLSNGSRILLPSVCHTNMGMPTQTALIAFSYNGKYLSLIHYQNSAFYAVLISASTWIVMWKKKIDFHNIQGLEWSPDSTIITIWNNSRKAQFLELNGDHPQTIHYHDPLASGFLMTMFSANCDLFFAICIKNKTILILIYNILTWQLSAVLDQENEIAKEFNTFSNELFSIKSQVGVSSCGTFAASSIVQGSVSVWNLKAGCKVCALINTHSSPAVLQWHPTRTKLAIVTENGEVHVWKSPQDGPTDKKSSLSSIVSSLTAATAILWSRKNLIVISTRPSQQVIMIVRSTKKQTI